MYKLVTETETSRTYRSEITGTEIETFLLKATPETGEKWWAFRDLLSIPFIRKKASQNLTQLYTAGLTKNDIDAFVVSLKKILKSSDSEKYEKAYSELMQFQALSDETADPNRQSLSLCTVYILSDTERIDVFSMKEAAVKVEQWNLQNDLKAFFLLWLAAGMNSYSQSYSELSAIASAIE